MSIEYLKSAHVEIKDGKTIDRVELAFSEQSELANVENISNGSLAWNKRTGEIFAYDDGEWYPQQ